ncbi:hypothetical protein FGSG_09044 [Fusarium graminearum PH-1]|uniref:hypothetical protein n=1 Tax=Gibberella zeae (strain ATCC MYA-4620 / CBS 123657 / FGSC 9075 / NRRL 31084 / PH-1) TaxID=229533 RepID=UPI00021F1E8D|nr:hypothetical protein FGSG_09044 [Fusarium graminearum PH-1]ESU15563.1 hypothetical protein FGSG_09044 [Fusarium graminearum PH-1]|eukprot:XP_011328753.1 hypothetical protein FGSG_09044 [Fusarium graminearum PH-1]
MADNSVTDYVSAVCSAVAAVIALVTVVTVVVAVRQLLTEHRAYSSGLSQQALGPWHERVRTKRLLGLFSFPGVAPSASEDSTDPEKALAKASWVNFLAAIGVKPNDQKLYQMSAQPNLINGIVPMRWEGKSLVAICSILGFQSSEQKPSFKQPVNLPMQWFGPLGYLQFREGPNGCIVEFRRRAPIADQISSDVHKFFKSIRQQTEEHSFVARLWRSINGMMIGDKKALYLGGSDDRFERRAKRLGAGQNFEKTDTNDTRPDFDALMKSKTPNVATPQTLTVAPTPDATVKRGEDNDLFDELMKISSKEDIMKTLQTHSYRKRKEVSKWESELDAELGGLRDLLRRMEEKKLGKMEVFVPCDGLLSVVIQGELANSRGLSIGDCSEYSRAYVDFEDVNQKTTPYRLGDLFMDETLLKLMKEAMRFIKPDGFYFTPTKWLASDVAEVYRHVYRVCENPKNEDDVLLPKHFRLHGHAQYTIRDMVVIGKASKSLPKVDDLVWSMLISPDLYKDFHRAFNNSVKELKGPERWNFLNAEVTCSGGVLNCTALMRGCGISRDGETKYATTGSTPPAQADPMDYAVPLCSDNTFTGSQVLASFLDVLVTHFWVEKSWITDVESYDHVIPQTITMC